MGISGLVVISKARNWASFGYIQGPEFHLIHNLRGKKNHEGLCSEKSY